MAPGLMSSTMVGPGPVRSLASLYTHAPPRVGRARRKLNSAARLGVSPTIMAATMVIMERLVPGHMAMHCMTPMKTALRHASASRGERPKPSSSDGNRKATAPV